MTTFTVTIDLENNAFREVCNFEIVRILRRVVEVLEHDSSPDLGMSLTDLNGNKVGFAGLGD